MKLLSSSHVVESRKPQDVQQIGFKGPEVMLWIKLVPNTSLQLQNPSVALVSLFGICLISEFWVQSQERVPMSVHLATVYLFQRASSPGDHQRRGQKQSLDRLKDGRAEQTVLSENRVNRKVIDSVWDESSPAPWSALWDEGGTAKFSEVSCSQLCLQCCDFGSWKWTLSHVSM